jgi:hypothetical protein
MGHEPNSRGLDDGALGIGGKLFPGQGTIVFAPELDPKRNKKGVHKKDKRKKPERPGEQLT